MDEDEAADAPAEREPRPEPDQGDYPAPGGPPEGDDRRAPAEWYTGDSVRADGTVPAATVSQRAPDVPARIHGRLWYAD